MRVDFILHVKLNMPGHQDEGLTHKEKKQAAQQVEHQYNNPEIEKAIAKNSIDNGLLVKTGKQAVNLNVFCDKVKGVADDLGGYYTKYIRDDDKKYTWNDPPFILVKIFI